MANTDFFPPFERLADEELTRRIASGELTDEAQAAAEIEARGRGLEIPQRRSGELSESYEGDLVLVARYLSPTEAHMLCACLNAGGVPAQAGDTELTQVHSLLAGAVGGASVRVPKNFVAEAQTVIEAFKRGDFALDEGFDTGSAE